MCNIVQAEFFLVTPTASEVGNSKALVQSPDDAPIKTTVRFFDAQATITNFALRYVRMSDQEQRLFDASVASRGWWRKLAESRHAKVARKLAAMKDEARSLAVWQLCNMLKVPSQVAVERPFRSFRQIDPSEIHELIETVKRSRSAWLFVQSGGLLDDEVKSVASVM